MEGLERDILRENCQENVKDGIPEEGDIK